MGCSTGAGLKRSGTSPFVGEATPTLLVKSVVSETPPGQTSQLSPGEFTQLLVHQLRSKGVRAFSADTGVAEADYVLTCTVPRLGYTIRPRYPRQVRHEAQLSCSITEPAGQVVRWQRDVERHYDVTTLLNTMTKLPPKHDSELLQECVLPVWDGMAYSVRLFLDRPQMAARMEPVSAMVSLPEKQVSRTDDYGWMK
jgi:hypothetical protein